MELVLCAVCVAVLVLAAVHYLTGSLKCTYFKTGEHFGGTAPQEASNCKDQNGAETTTAPETTITEFPDTHPVTEPETQTPDPGTTGVDPGTTEANPYTEPATTGGVPDTLPPPPETTALEPVPETTGEPVTETVGAGGNPPDELVTTEGSPNTIIPETTILPTVAETTAVF